ncbi:tRNA modification GTPase mnmE, partial [Candidatus Arthromitus sp. SFB-4]
MSTIVGLATALSSSAVNIIRISGDKSLEIAEKIFHTKKELNPNEIKYGFIKYDGEIYDEVLVSFMKAPKSFTGEDII